MNEKTFKCPKCKSDVYIYFKGYSSRKFCLHCFEEFLKKYVPQVVEIETKEVKQ